MVLEEPDLTQRMELPTTDTEEDRDNAAQVGTKLEVGQDDTTIYCEKVSPTDTESAIPKTYRDLGVVDDGAVETINSGEEGAEAAVKLRPKPPVNNRLCSGSPLESRLNTCSTSGHVFRYKAGNLKCTRCGQTSSLQMNPCSQ